MGTEGPAIALLNNGSVRTAPSIWTRSYARILLAGDLACAVIACESVLGVRLWFGAYIPGTEALLGLGLALAWPFSLAVGALIVNAPTERGRKSSGRFSTEGSA